MCSGRLFYFSSIFLIQIISDVLKLAKRVDQDESRIVCPSEAKKVVKGPSSSYPSAKSIVSYLLSVSVIWKVIS